MRKYSGAKRKRQAASLLLAVVLAAVSVAGPGTLPVSAEEPAGDTYVSGPCEHHTEHTEDCGYREAVEGNPCQHKCTDECYESIINCVHEHTEACYLEGNGLAEGGDLMRVPMSAVKQTDALQKS